MSTIACPYCYQRFRPSRMRYQCTGRPAPGKNPCAKTVDRDRETLTNYSAASWPTFEPPESGFLQPKLPHSPDKAACPDCGGSTGIRACPQCRTPLPANFGEGRSPLISIIGAKNAGKTVYTTVLVHELWNRTRPRFDADLTFVGESAGWRATDWFERYQQALFGRRALFEATPSAPLGVQAPLLLQWRQPRRGLGKRGHNSTMLSFYDAAGEDMTTQDVVNSQAYLGAADGLIVLLDPFQLPGVADRITLPEADRRDAEPPLSVLTRITELLRASGGVRARNRIPVPISVVLSKIDAFFELLGETHPLLREPEPGPHYDEAAGRDTDEHVRALLDEFGADEIDAHLRAHYRTYRYFAVSSLGAEPDYGRKVLDPGGVRPFRVSEPLLWLLGHFKIVGRRT